eukprot:c23661_g1_i1 orf=201-2033(+)
MAMAAPQEPAQAGVANTFSHATAAAAASMVSIFPHQILFHHNSCKAAASAPPLMLNTVDSTSSQFEAKEIYGFPDESPPLPLKSMPVHTIGAGLTNLGNTCFLNSVLQCLTYTPPLAAYLQNGLHNSTCDVKGFCAMCALERHVREALASNGRTISPSYLVNNLRYISRSFQLWRQEDAHEYMRYLIEALQKCSSVELFDGKSLVKNVFGGRLRSQVKCTHCSHCSNKYDPFLDLSLEVARADSLQKALAHFTATEVLDGDNKYHCSKCKTKVRALKQFTIDKAPSILTVQFKRFSSSGAYGGKIDKRVHFESTLDLKPFVNGGEDEELSYSLYAVLVHSGWSTHSGHYYCFVRTAMDTWHAMDDSQVSKVSERTVLEQKAYILFYKRNTKPTVFQNGNHPHKSSKDSPMTVDQKLEMDMLRETVAGDSPEKLHSKLDLETGEGCCLTDVTGSCSTGVTEVNKNLGTIEEVNAVVLNGVSESSQCGSLKTSDSSCLDVNITVETQAKELVCSRHIDVKIETQSVAQSVCIDDNLCNSDVTNHSEDDKKFGRDGDELLISDADKKQSRCLIFNVTAPMLRNSVFETAGHRAFRILCMCAKFCFWSCFWSPL